MYAIRSYYVGIQRNILVISHGKYHNTKRVNTAIKELNEISAMVEELAEKLESYNFV